METRPITPGTVKCTTPLLLGAIVTFCFGACQEDLANLDLIQATPVHAMLMVPVSDEGALRFAWNDGQKLPYSDQIEGLLSTLPIEDGGVGLLSLHPVGAGTHHWAYCIRREFTPFHPSQLSRFEPSRRAYASGIIWEWQDDRGTWALAETAEWLILSTTDILAEEGIRQWEARSAGSSYAAYPDLAEQLSSYDMVTLTWTEGAPLSQAWMVMPEGKRAFSDDQSTWRLAHPESCGWDVRFTADSTAKVAVSEAKYRSGILEFVDSIEARAFPGWRWLTPGLHWAQWTAVDSRVSYQGHPIAIQAQGECIVEGRGGQLHRVTLRFQETANLRIPHWVPSSDFVAPNDLKLKNPLAVLPYIKTMGAFILTSEDTLAANRYLAYIPDVRDSAQEAHYQAAIRYVRSQPSEGQLWWVARQADAQAPWAGLTYRAQGDKSYWSASILVP